MTETNNKPETQETNIVAVSPETNALVEKEMTGQDESIKEATKALVEAIKKRAQSEIKNAQTITRDAYLKAVNNAREAIEENQLIERKRIEHSVKIRPGSNQGDKIKSIGGLKTENVIQHT